MCPTMPSIPGIIGYHTQGFVLAKGVASAIPISNSIDTATLCSDVDNSKVSCVSEIAVFFKSGF